MTALNCKCEIIKNFIPSWFASVMGTGGLALAAMAYSKYLPILKNFGTGLFYFNIVLFCVLLIPWILRWFLFKENAIKDLYNPVLGNFYPTISAAMLVLAADFIVIGKNIFWAEIFWFSGVIITIFFAFLIPYISFTNEKIELHHINPGWFIPPVALIVIPIPGAFLIPHFSGLMKDIIILINYFGFGAGFFLFIALFAISLYRFILHKPLPDILAPTIWINLGPIGAGTSALLGLIKFTPFLEAKMPLYILGSFFWVFGLWWVVMSIIMTLHYIKKIKFPYTMAWWALTFPLATFVGATHGVAMILKNTAIDYIGFGLLFLLIFLWAITLIKTAKRTVNGSLFISQK